MIAIWGGIIILKTHILWFLFKKKESEIEVFLSFFTKVNTLHLLFNHHFRIFSPFWLGFGSYLLLLALHFLSTRAGCFPLSMYSSNRQSRDISKDCTTRMEVITLQICQEWSFGWSHWSLMSTFGGPLSPPVYLALIRLLKRLLRPDYSFHQDGLPFSSLILNNKNLDQQTHEIIHHK